MTIKIYRIGFTGTQIGMTESQRKVIRTYLSNITHRIEFHHGDCIGADKEAHFLAKSVNAAIVIHPPSISSKRAFCQGDYIYTVKSYIVRNHDIVDDVQIMLATPKESTEVLRSGTWATIRYARKIGRELIIIAPDGLRL